ncbi:TraV family lipoprotein [Pseudomonas sp. P5_152]|uniref:TraV family lipoprotein n=1 Tax=Pseudomonas sp. P5_152 TaxID=3043442 RepID=UPI002A3656DE|nr:TraV family lipoprotein [Pseudomonas sp. P5_152]MDX9668647.1 TraV family lipoprotein [Pseudomonas sp. P5_152]
MMSYRRYLIACITLTLTGCAGMKDDFDCKAVASDSCMTMRQADEMAKEKDQTEKREYSSTRSQSSGKGEGTGRARLPSLIDMSRSLVPVRMNRISLMPTQVLRYAPSVPFTPVSLIPVDVLPGVSAPATPVTSGPIKPSQTCTLADCPPSMRAPQREIESVVSLWVAPYIDGIDAVHAPAELYFVRNPTTWRDRYEP